MIPTKINFASLLCCFQIVFSMLFNMFSMLLRAACHCLHRHLVILFLDAIWLLLTLYLKESEWDLNGSHANKGSGNLLRNTSFSLESSSLRQMSLSCSSFTVIGVLMYRIYDMLWKSLKPLSSKRKQGTVLCCLTIARDKPWWST